MIKLWTLLHYNILQLSNFWPCFAMVKVIESRGDEINDMICGCLWTENEVRPVPASPTYSPLKLQALATSVLWMTFSCSNSNYEVFSNLTLNQFSLKMTFFFISVINEIIGKQVMWHDFIRICNYLTDALISFQVQRRASCWQKPFQGYFVDVIYFIILQISG